MRRALVVLLATCAALLSIQPAQAAIAATPVREGLDFPAAFTVASDGRIFYGERFTGEIRVIDPGAGTDRPFFTVPDVTTDGEKGVLGIALHPNFPTTPSVYVRVTRLVAGVDRNQIVRIANSKMTPLLTMPVNRNHNGGRIMFGPDKRLYTVVGDLGQPSLAQNTASNAGKILRLNDDGSMAAGNPFGNRVFAYGIRNSFGFDFDPLTGRLWESENGPSCNDEINRIPIGRNMGWGPTAACDGTVRGTNRDGPNPLFPRRVYTPTTAPTGVVFCNRCGLGHGRVFVGEWNTGRIRWLTLDADRVSVTADRVVYEQAQGILSLERGPDGAIYFSDSNGIYRLNST